jgi:23S rRNA (guanine745-N1)-methyltransferase
MITPFQALACPLDGGPLRRHGTSWRCDAGHCFDIAAQGYTNLLPVQQKRSRDPGDSKEMVAARRRYLNAGFYQPIAALVSRAVLADLPAGRAAACLDAGCGEGYYLRELAAAGDGQRLALLGLDISKWAVLAAAKQDKRPNWVVGSNANLPVLPATLDRVLCMFGFPVYAEFARVLRPGGELLQVDAGPDHLRELREIIYPTLKPERAAEPLSPAGFSVLPAESLRYTVTLGGAEQIGDLLTMTPHLYRASAEGRARRPR